jgi:adenylylsulfate kinase-like enzyme
VLLRVREETLQARDQTALFPGRAGIDANVPGAGQPYELPLNPDLVLDNDDGGDSPPLHAARILERLFPVSRSA